MTESQFTILTFLESSAETFFARKEIARRAVKRKVCEEDPHWADAPLALLVTMGMVEMNESGLYRLKPEKDDDEEKKRISQRIDSKTGLSHELPGSTRMLAASQLDSPPGH